MSKFKVGDKVRAKDIRQFSFKSKVVTVSSVSEDTFKSDNSIYHSYDYNMSAFILIEASDPIEDAKRTLEEAGYTVTPPPEKKSGRVVVYEAYGCIKVLPQEKFNPRDTRTMLAIVDWEEGQGL